MDTSYWVYDLKPIYNDWILEVELMTVYHYYIQYIWNILKYISQIMFKMDSFDVLKVLEKFYVGRKILVFVHYGVGWILRLDFELVREIIWRNSVWESFRSCWVEKLCPSKNFVVHLFSSLYGGQKLLT